MNEPSNMPENTPRIFLAIDNFFNKHRRAIVMVIIVIVASVGILGLYKIYQNKFGLPKQPSDSLGNVPITPRDNISIKAENGRFEPSQVTAQKGKMVVFSFTAVDAVYDFGFADPKIGFDQIAKTGETVSFGFVPKEAGEFIFQCIQYCPLNKKMEGKLMVK